MSNIAKTAVGYLGQTEKAGNSGFTAPAFEKKMQGVGFQPGHAWCAYFVELCLKEGVPAKAAELDKLCSASAVKTYDNFKAAGKLVGMIPKPGAVAVWRHGSGWQGHTGIVETVTPDGKGFTCIEGNTNDAGGREGYIVARKNRKLGLPYTDKGLNLIGFIYVD